MLRLNDSHTTTGGELTRLVGLAESYLSVGAEGVAFGFLDSDLGIDVEVCTYLADQLPGVPWTFHRAVDSALETDRAWRQLRRPARARRGALRRLAARDGGRARGAHRPGRRRPRRSPGC